MSTTELNHSDTSMSTFELTPSDTLMSLKFGSQTPQASPTNTCSTMVNDGATSTPGHGSTPGKPEMSLHRRALYSMTYDDASVDLRRIQSCPMPNGLRLPGVKDMLNGVLPHQSRSYLQRPSLPRNEQALPRRRRRHVDADSCSNTSTNSHAQSPRQRVSVACTFCRARKLRCTPGPPPCEHCRRRSHPCIFEYQSQHRDQQSPNVTSSSTPRDWPGPGHR